MVRALLVAWGFSRMMLVWSLLMNITSANRALNPLEILKSLGIQLSSLGTKAWCATM